MVEEKRHVVVVCGYGCHAERDNPHVQGYCEYLSRVFRFGAIDLPDIMIFCGGFTQRKTAPGVSEAGLMRNFIDVGLHPPSLTLRTITILEEGSYTTLENIRNAAAAIRNWVFHHAGGEKVRITIFCEAQRSPNVDQLARHFMKDLVDKDDHIDIETASWERADPFKQAGNLIHNKLAITFPWLGLAERERRKRIKRSEQI